MRNTTLAIAAILLGFAGCNTGGNCTSMRPSIFGRMGNCLGGANNVGAPCNAGASSGSHCDPCGETARQSGYGEQVIGSYETPMGSTVGGTIDGIPVGSSVLPPGAYIGSPTPSSINRGEVIRPKPAN
jgi:hypothetical protein